MDVSINQQSVKTSLDLCQVITKFYHSFINFFAIVKNTASVLLGFYMLGPADVGE